jgi:hypothetical protein
MKKQNDLVAARPGTSARPPTGGPAGSSTHAHPRKDPTMAARIWLITGVSSLRWNSTRKVLPEGTAGEVGPGGIRRTSWPWLPSSGWDGAR